MKKLNGTTEKTWQWINEHGDDYMQHLFHDVLKSKMGKKDIEDFEMLKKDPEKAKLLRNSAFTYGYSRLIHFHLDNLNLFTFEPNDIKDLANMLIARPWYIEYVNSERFTGWDCRNILTAVSIINEHPEACEKLYTVIDKLNIAEADPSVKEDILDVFTGLISLDYYLDTNGIHDEDMLKSASLKMIETEYGKTNSVLALYREYGNTMLTPKDDVFASMYRRGYGSDRVREDLSKFMRYSKYLEIPGLDIDSITSVVVQYQEYLINTVSPITPRASILSTIDAGGYIRRYAKKAGCSYNEMQQTVNRINDLLKARPIFPDEYYKVRYSRTPGYYKNLLDRDVERIKLASHKLYTDYEKLLSENHTITNGTKAEQYKKFAQLLLSRAKKGNPSYTNSTLFDLISTIDNFDRKEYETLSENLPELTLREKTALRGFYQSKIVASDCMYPKTRDNFIDDSSLIVIKGKLITKEVKEAIIEYMEAKNQPLYSPIYMATVRAWFDKRLSIPGLDPDDLPDYAGQ